MNYQEELKKFKRSNKDARERIALRKGFANATSYITFLLSNGKNTGTQATKKKKPTIHNIYILDVSSSMAGGKIESAIQGINAELTSLKASTNVIYIQSIVTFAGQYDIRRDIWERPIQEVGYFTSNTRGVTALFKAAGGTIESLLDNRVVGDKYLVKIFTDGDENDSKTGKYANIGHSYAPSCPNLANLIEKAEAADFTITFVGTKQDTAKMIEVLKIDQSNTFSHENTKESVRSAFAASAGATMAYADNVVKCKSVTKGFYKKVGKL